MRQSLLLTLHERFERAGSKGIYTDYTMQDMKDNLPIADILCEAVAVMLDDAIRLEESNCAGDRWIGFHATRLNRDIALECHCGRGSGMASAASVFRLDTLWGIAARRGGRVEWNEQDDSAVVLMWLPYRTDVSDGNPQAIKDTKKRSDADSEPCSAAEM